MSTWMSNVGVSLSIVRCSSSPRLFDRLQRLGRCLRLVLVLLLPLLVLQSSVRGLVPFVAVLGGVLGRTRHGGGPPFVVLLALLLLPDGLQHTLASSGYLSQG